MARARIVQYSMKRNIKIIIALIITLVASLGMIAFLTHKNTEDKKFSIVTTNFSAYDFARAVAGDQAQIKMLLKPGVDMHGYEPSPEDIIDIENCSLFIYTGGESDEWIEGILENTHNINTLRMMDVVKPVEEETVEGMESEEEDKAEVEYDEHVWTSLRNAQLIIDAIQNRLSEIYPDERASFAQNSANYKAKLADLDRKFQSIVDNSSRRTLVFGDRFPLRYFVDDYNLEYFAAFPGCSEQNEASSKTISYLVNKIKTEEIPVVLKIELTSDDIAQTIANETGAKVLVFSAAHNISAEDFENGRTYADIMEANLAVLEEALNE